MIKTLSVFGTRPEAIKMAPLVKALEAEQAIDSHVCVTAQHREMLDQVLDAFEIKADYDLDLMKPGQDLAELTGRIITCVRDIIRDVKPDLVLVHGDTTTCFSASMAAFYEQVAIGHVEAGLRTGDLTAPFPEEANRTLVARLANLHFAPTALSKQNLVNERVKPECIHLTGNTVIDALMWMSEKVQANANDWVRPFFESSDFDLISNKENYKRTILITGHRRENFGQGFLDLCNALRTIALDHPDWLLVYPVHLNPKVQKPVNDILSGIDNVKLIAPLSYQPFVWLLNRCDLILTDSGGIQEEGPSLGKPVLVMREVTERPEAIQAGTVRLVGTDTKNIIENVEALLTNASEYQKMSRAINPYGDGLASERIIDAIKRYFGVEQTCPTPLREFA